MKIFFSFCCCQVDYKMTDKEEEGREKKYLNKLIVAILLLGIGSRFRNEMPIIFRFICFFFIQFEISFIANDRLSHIDRSTVNQRRRRRIERKRRRKVNKL